MEFLELAAFIVLAISTMVLAYATYLLEQKVNALAKKIQ